MVPYETEFCVDLRAMSVEGGCLPFNEILDVPRVPGTVRMDKESRPQWTGG